MGQDCDDSPNYIGEEDNGVEDVLDCAKNGIGDGEESTGSIPSPPFSGTRPSKRLRSKVWEDFIPTFVDGKVVKAECMHCHRVFNYSSTNGTTGLRNHLAKCSPKTQKRLKQQVGGPLPSARKSTPANSSDPNQKKLPFLLSRQNQCTGTVDAVPVEELAFPDGDAHINKNTKNQEVDQNGSHEVLAAPEISTDQHKNHSHGGIALPEQDFPDDSNQNQNQKVDQNCSPEELVRILAIHGHLPRMMEQDGFRKVAACLNPMVNMPSHYDFIGNIRDLFQQEKSKLKEKLAALSSRVCLSAYMWHYDPHLSFLCLTVHYINDEWEKQQKIITFSPLDPSCDAKQYCDIIVGAITEWDLHDKVFSIIVDGVFIDDSVASNIKTSLQKWNKVNANRNLFVVRYATHLLDQVIHVGLDELNKIMEKSAKCPKYAKGSNHSAVQYPNIRYAPSPEDWSTASEISEILEHFHVHIDSMPNFPGPSNLFNTLKNVYSKAHSRSRYTSDKAISKVVEKMKQKFKECWKSCFLHFCMPMVMDPTYSLTCIKLFVKENGKHDYMHEVRDTFLNLFNEYTDQVDDPDCTTRSKTGMVIVEDADTLSKYYHDSKPYYYYDDSEDRCCNRPMTELGQYLQETRPGRPASNPSVLQWWKEHSLIYPTISQMARDILALPCSTDSRVATRTAGLAMCELAGENHIEMLVCTQDWLTPAGTRNVESPEDEYFD